MSEDSRYSMMSSKGAEYLNRAHYRSFSVNIFTGEPLAEFPEGEEFRVVWIAGAGGSGWRWPEAGDAEDLIGGERDDAEHEVAFDLDRAAHAQEPGAEFVL